VSRSQQSDRVIRGCGCVPENPRMLFTTVPFILLFLPLALAGFFLLGRWRPGAAAGWLFFASLVFYGFWMPKLTILLVGSVAFNFMIGLQLAQCSRASREGRNWLILGVTADLGLLAYFKYANFFVSNFDLLFGTRWDVGFVILPIGISFFTFTQIAFLVDTYRGKVNEFNPVHYGLFVTYFPHLVAGPVLHHAQMMPQFAQPSIYRFDGGNFTGGLCIFAIGLLKKVVFADGISPYADAAFNPADAGSLPGFEEAWLGALAYTLQLYFDFSGYSDMAIGLSWMFNVRLPFNFDSPYRAASISEFWRRWHMTLSTFLRDYLYFALGGNRHGSVRRYANLATTMVLGGLWHGASWSFVLWGALHGAYLMINHGFRAACGAVRCQRLGGSRVFRIAAWSITMLAVVVAWVLFRSETLAGAVRMLRGMAGIGPTQSPLPLLWNAGLHLHAGLIWCGTLGVIAVLPINSNRIGLRVLDRVRADVGARWYLGTLAVCSVLFLLLVNTARSSVSAFIYFNF